MMDSVDPLVLYGRNMKKLTMKAAENMDWHEYAADRRCV